jgi:hypothetical protein
MSCPFNGIMERRVPGGYRVESASRQQGGRT